MSKINLATTTNVTSTYAGELDAVPYIQAAFMTSPTFKNRTITIKENIKYKSVVKKLATTGLISAGDCDATPTGTVTLTERILEPKEFQLVLNLCKNDYISDWEAMSMGASANDENLPANFQEFLIGNCIATVGYNNGFDTWQGVGGADHFSGFTTLFLLDSDVVDVSGTTITSSNVQAELAKVVEAAGALNTWGEGQRIYAAKNVIFSYLISLGGFGANGLGAAGYMNQGPTNVQSAPLYFGGIEIVEAELPSNEIVCTQPSNLWFGTSLTSDFTQVSVIDKAPLDFSKNVLVGMRWTAGVQYGVGSEIVYYHIY